MPRAILLTAFALLALSVAPARGEDAPPAGGLGPIEARADSAGRAAAAPDSAGRIAAAPGDSLRRGALGDSLGRRAPADSIRRGDGRPWHRQPRWIMLRSIALPGWGQWANGKHVKAVVVAAGEGYLIWRGVDYGRQERETGREARLAAEDPARQAELLERKRYYGSRRRDFTWWSIFAAVLSMGDAYVDAHLGPFDPEFVPQDGSGGFGLDGSDGGERSDRGAAGGGGRSRTGGAGPGRAGGIRLGLSLRLP